MQIELGSNFNLLPNDMFEKKRNLHWYMKNYTCQWYKSGREAIRSLQYKKENVVLLPEYICESVIKCFEYSKIEFYSIDEMFGIDENDLFNKMNSKVGVVYICHYFGFVQNKKLLKKIKERATEIGAIVIEDTTQSFFSMQGLIGDVGIMSVRKWIPISQGGVVYVSDSSILNDDYYTKLEKNCNDSTALGMFLKSIYLKGICDTNSIYRDIFTKFENELDVQDTVEKISDLAYLQMKCVDIVDMIESRKKNAKYLREALKDINIECVRTFSKEECPFAFPLRVKQRDKLRKYLIENNIYCAVHWPIDKYMSAERKNARQNAEHLISLPIDQRYGKREMDYMIDVINRYRGEILF